MRGIVYLGAGILAGLLAASTGAQAAADISVFSYPPAVDNFDRPRWLRRSRVKWSTMTVRIHPARS